MVTTSFFALESVSSVPNEPSVGVAIVQSPVIFGHAVLAGAPAGLIAARSSEAVPPITLSPLPVTSPTAGLLKNWRSFTGLGHPGRNWPLLAFHAPRKS